MADLSFLRAGLTNYEVYIDGTRLLGTASIDLPDIQFQTIETKGNGIAGTIDLSTPGNTDSFEITLNWRSIHTDLSMLSRPIGQDLILYGALHQYNQSTGAIRASQVKISFRGIAKQLTLGTFEPSANTDSKSVFEIVRLKVEVDGEEAVLIDKLNYTFKLNGTDFYADVRRALGLDW